MKNIAEEVFRRAYYHFARPRSDVKDEKFIYWLADILQQIKDLPEDGKEEDIVDPQGESVVSG